MKFKLKFDLMLGLCLVLAYAKIVLSECPTGYHHQLNDNTTCHDVNECATNRLTNICSQVCINLQGSYRCECFDYYQMVDNSTNCEIKDESPILYYSTGKQIRALNVRTQINDLVIETNNESELLLGIDMFVYYDGSKLFYYGISEGNKSRRFLYEDSISGGMKSKVKPKPKLLYHEDVQSIAGISVDWLAYHFYITDSINNRIMVCNFDMIVCATLLNRLSSPHAIFTMPSKAKLFWTQLGENPGIFQAEMNGRDAKPLIDNVTWPNDLALDELMERLYWCDTKQGSIEYYDFTVKVRHLVFKDQNRQPYALSVFDDQVYWSDWATNQIVVCHKITCQNMNILMNAENNRFYGLKMYHPTAQYFNPRRPRNVCLLIPCSHLCLLREQGTAFSCYCPDEMFISANGITCIANPTERDIIEDTTIIQVTVENEPVNESPNNAQNCPVASFLLKFLVFFFISTVSIGSIFICFCVKSLTFRRRIAEYTMPGLNKLRN